MFVILLSVHCVDRKLPSVALVVKMNGTVEGKSFGKASFGQLG